MVTRGVGPVRFSLQREGLRVGPVLASFVSVDAADLAQLRLIADRPRRHGRFLRAQ
jgi:hypothetical protein